MAIPDLRSNTAEGQHQNLVKPDYLSYRPAEGVFIQLQNFHSAGSFMDFVNSLFSGDSRFADLNYDTFLKLLYDADWLEAARTKTPEVKIASGIVHFPQNRRALYRTVKVMERGKYAEYVFEPVSIAVTAEEPLHGEADAHGVAPVVGQSSEAMLQPTKLDFDEFVAMMWAKGVKYGINAETVRKIISEGKSARITVAEYLEPEAGQDAYIQELSPDLHRDNSPKTLLNGKADLRAFKNRFPQIAKGTRLLKKVPRVFGKHGYKVTGEIITPPDPLELNLLALTSNGTAIENDKGVDYIVAQMDGFLTIDPLLNLISISEKIETTSGISMKTTGDLTLGVEEFVEHGEVQEGRVVKGKHMTFKSNVFGNLLSAGGNITVDGNLTGGGAESQGGNITVAHASRAVVRACDGEVKIRFCENCTVIGKTIRVERAANCELIAEEVYADAIEGCMIAATTLRVLSASDSKSRESLISMMIPDLSEFDLKTAKLEEKAAGCRSAIAGKKEELEQLKADQDFAKFLVLYAKIKSGEIKLTTEQAGNWQKLMTKNATPLNKSDTISKQIAALERLHDDALQEISAIKLRRESAGAGISCEIAEIAGHTSGQTIKSGSGIQPFHKMSGSEIKTALQQADGLKAKIFSEDSGSINWHYR